MEWGNGRVGVQGPGTEAAVSVKTWPMLVSSSKESSMHLGASSGNGRWGKGGIGVASLGKVFSGGTCRPGEAVGCRTFQMDSECSGGELPQAAVHASRTLTCRSADQLLSSARLVGFWGACGSLGCTDLPPWPALIYHPGPKQVKSPRVVWILLGLVTQVLESAVWQETFSVLFGGSLRALEV